MKRLLLTFAIVAAPLVAFADAKPAADAAQKEITLVGEVGCGHCSFKVTDKCADALKVKEGGKVVVYLLAEDAARKHDEAMCESTRQATVTGVIVGEKGGKKLLKASKIDFAPAK